MIVTCGPEEFAEGIQDVLLNPIILMEVLSPSTEGYDRGDKFLYCQSIPSFREYVLVSQTTRWIEIFRRQEDGSWNYQTFPFSEPPVVLESIGCSLSFEGVYSKVEIAEPAADDRAPL